MSDQRCGTCRYWPRSGWGEINDEESGMAGGERSECRRRAPILVTQPALGFGVTERAAWPWTDRTSFCGEWECRTVKRGDE